MKDVLVWMFFVFIGGFISTVLTTMPVTSAVHNCEIRWDQKCHVIVAPESIVELLTRR